MYNYLINQKNVKIIVRWGWFYALVMNVEYKRVWRVLRKVSKTFGGRSILSSPALEKSAESRESRLRAKPNDKYNTGDGKKVAKLSDKDI